MRFLYRRDPRGRIRFAALASPTGRALLRAHGLPEGTRDTLVLVHEGRAHTRSTGALHAARLLRAPWPLLARAALVAPRSWRDAAYDAVARRRDRVLHARACPAPPEGLRARMLDEEGS